MPSYIPLLFNIWLFFFIVYLICNNENVIKLIMLNIYRLCLINSITYSEKNLIKLTIWLFANNIYCSII